MPMLLARPLSLQSILIELHRLEKEFEAREGVTRQETAALVTQVEASRHTSQLKEAVDRQEKTVLLVGVPTTQRWRYSRSCWCC
jgi:hypothetical protein